MATTPGTLTLLERKGGVPMRLHAQDERFERPEVRGRIHGLVALS